MHDSELRPSLVCLRRRSHQIQENIPRQARTQKCGLDFGGGRRHSNGGAEGADEDEVWGGVPLPQWG